MVFFNKVLLNIISVLKITNSKINTNKEPHSFVKEPKDSFIPAPQTSSTPTQLPYPEDTTTTSTISASEDNARQGNKFYLISLTCL